MIHSFLMIGQSNMAGRGHISEVEPIHSPRLWVLRNGRWQPMYTPVNCDRPFSGVSLAESFAQRYSELHEVDVGLIPCADGGTSMDQWAPGGLLYDHAVMQAKLAMRTSMLCGVLWHQGETDCPDQLYPYYEEKLRAMLAALRAELGNPQLPVVMGTLGDYLAESSYDPNLKNYHYINDALQRIANPKANIALALAEGLTCNADQLHFNAKSLREFGLRYEKAYESLLPSPIGKGEEKNITLREMERL
ncbi:MAG: sialate O-acetylesterase [Candidatus Merdivicinus sp.]|jgi:hypothetical protein